MADHRFGCTWKGCASAGEIPQYDAAGRCWANLCTEHCAELQAAIDSGVPGKLCRAWVLAKGGAERAAQSI